MADHDELARTLAERMHPGTFELRGALEAHTEWKRRLRDAVIRGYFEQGADDAGRDDLCALGRWLHSLSEETRGEPLFEEVVERHARFHREAAGVVQSLELGRIDEARAAMDADSAFAHASEDLVGLLEAWQDAA